MKFNAEETHNQRLERITQKTLVIGVDIAKEFHVGQAGNFRGMILSKKPIRFQNSANGFREMMREVQSLQRKHRLTDLVIGMEATGHYWIGLAEWLARQGVQVVLVNPLVTSRNKENRDNTPSKSDPKDAVVIADVIARGYYTLYQPDSPLYQQIRSLAKARDRVKQDETRVVNRIHRWIDLYFPELQSVFQDVFCPRALATLHQFSAPMDLAELTPHDVVNEWKRYGMSRPGGVRGLQKAKALLRAARESVGYTQAIDEARWELQRFLKQYDEIQKDLSDLDEMNAALLPKVPESSALQSIGLTPNLCIALLGYGGDLSRLKHGNQLLRKAGMNLAEKSSGNYRGKIKLSKRGSSMLRKHLFLAVIYLIKNTTAFGALHDYNVQTKRMTKMQSVMKLIGKLARILVSIVRTKTEFSSEQVMPAVA